MTALIFSSHIKAQVKTWGHVFSVVIFGFLCAACYIWPYLTILLPIAGIFYSIFLKAHDIIVNMIISIVITTIASLINPILGIIVALFFLFKRISFFYENWRGIVAGVVVYGFPYLFISMFETFAYDYLRTGPWVDLGIVAILSALFLHVMLIWLYKHGYTHKQAIVSMTLAPLILLLFIIPFLLKAAALFDDLLAATAADFDHDYDVDVDGINPETHVVEGHYRTLPSGEEIYIEAHIRTNPNATITDNISYRG